MDDRRFEDVEADAGARPCLVIGDQIVRNHAAAVGRAVRGAGDAVLDLELVDADRAEDMVKRHGRPSSSQRPDDLLRDQGIDLVGSEARLDEDLLRLPFPPGIEVG